MGLSSSGSSTSGSAQKWAQPYAVAGARTAQDFYGKSQQQADALGQNLQGLIPSLTQRFTAGNPGVQAAQGHATDVLGGKFLNGNPYLDAVLGRTRRDVGDDVNSMFAGAGRYGSGAHVGVMTDRLADAENSARMGDYNTQMGRMDQMAALTPTLAQAQYTGLPELLQTSGAIGNITQAPMQNYTNSLGNLFNGSTQTGPGLGRQLLAGASQAASSAMMASDVRVKTDISRVGTLDNGLGVYAYRYKDGGPMQIGVMAQEVEVSNPEAVQEIGGIKHVDYRKAVR